MGDPIFALTDGYTRIDLLPHGTRGVRVTKLTAGRPQAKGGGYFADSPLAWGRQPVARMLTNPIDIWETQIVGCDQDDVAFLMQEFARLMDKGFAFWVNYDLPILEQQEQFGPVWIEERGANETNIRYAYVVAYGIDGDPDPYHLPMYGSLRNAIVDKLPISVEHTLWQAQRPDDPDCMPVSGVTDPTNASCLGVLYFDGDDQATLTSHPFVDNLAQNAFTAEAWVMADVVDVNREIICKPGSVARGWELFVQGANGRLRATVYCATTNATSYSSNGLVVADGKWHHVAMTYDNAGDRKIRLFYDGAEVAYLAQNAGVGLIVSDSADTMCLGANAAISANWLGYIGWTRISNNARYAAPFTPAAQSYMPSIDANTVGLWVHDGSGTVLHNLQGTVPLDGALTAAPNDPSWAFLCESVTEFGRAKTCAPDEVYFGNCFQTLNLSHIFRATGGGVTFGPNLLYQPLPYNLIDDVSNPDDAIYFGVQGDALTSIPVTSIVFDISHAAGMTSTVVWEYWDGIGWTLYTDADRYDQTQSWLRQGVGVVTMRRMIAQQTLTVNGVEAYWARARIVIPGVHAQTQNNRHPYMVTNPYLLFAADDIQGDLPARLRLLMKDRADNYPLLRTANATRFVVGTRSLARGADFCAFLNAHEKQNASGVTASVLGAVTTFQGDIALAGLGANVRGSHTSRVARWTVGAATPIASVLRWSLTAAVANQYFGMYRVFVRYWTAAATKTCTIRLIANQSTYGVVAGTTTAEITNTSPGGSDVSLVMDLGLLDLRAPLIASDTLSGLSFDLQLGTTAAGGATIYIQDVIIFPADEVLYDVLQGQLQWGEMLDVDSVNDPRRHARLFTRLEADPEQIVKFLDATYTAPLGLVPRAEQRIWVFTHTSVRSFVEKVNTVEMSKVELYYGMRGAR